MSRMELTDASIRNHQSGHGHGMRGRPPRRSLCDDRLLVLCILPFGALKFEGLNCAWKPLLNSRSKPPEQIINLFIYIISLRKCHVLCIPKILSVLNHRQERLSSGHDRPVPFSAGPIDGAVQAHVAAGGGKHRTEEAAECLASQDKGAARLTNSDRGFFVVLYRLFPSILDAIRIIQPETLVRWHRSGFWFYWRWKSRHRVGRPKIDGELRALIRRMTDENPLWGAPRIHCELLKLGFDVAQSTVAKYMNKQKNLPPCAYR